MLSVELLCVKLTQITMSMWNSSSQLTASGSAPWTETQWHCQWVHLFDKEPGNTHVHLFSSYTHTHRSYWYYIFQPHCCSWLQYMKYLKLFKIQLTVFFLDLHVSSVIHSWASGSAVDVLLSFLFLPKKWSLFICECWKSNIWADVMSEYEAF